MRPHACSAMFFAFALVACAKPSAESRGTLQVDLESISSARSPASSFESEIVQPQPDWHLYVVVQKVRAHVEAPDALLPLDDQAPPPGQPEYFGEEPGGWVTLFSSERRFDLLDGGHASLVLGQGTVPEGRYDAVRVIFGSDVDLVTTNEAPSVRCPRCGLSGVRFAFDTPTAVRAQQHVVVSLKLDRDQSLRRGESGLVFAPAIRATTAAAPGP